jgi:hypothetical protein
MKYLSRLQAPSFNEWHVSVHYGFFEALTGLPGTKSQLRAMRMRSPVPMPNDAGEPIACKIARLQNPPTKTEETAISL